MFVLGKPVHPSVMQHSSLLGLFVSYEENELLWMHTQFPFLFNLDLKYYSGYSQDFVRVYDGYATCHARNVPCTCLDQIDADRGIVTMSESHKLIPSWSYQMYFSNCSFYDWCYPFLSPTRCLSHTLSLCLSAISLSSPTFPFDIKCCPTIWWVSINKRIP